MKNTKQKLLIIPFLLILPIITSPILGISSTLATTEGSPPIGIGRPEGTLASKVQILGFLRNLESANFTDDDVYFSDYSSVGGYEYQVHKDNDFSVSVNLAKLNFSVNRTIIALKLNNSGMATPEMIRYFEGLHTELKTHSSLEISHSTEIDLTVNTKIDRKIVTILYDPDRSVIEALGKIRTNETITSQPFTGDEILTTVLLTLAKDSIHGLYSVNNTWQYENGSEALMLKNFISRLNTNMWKIRELKQFQYLRDINLLRAIDGPVRQRRVVGQQTPIKNSYGSFSVSQLLIDELNIVKRGKNLVVDKLDYRYIEHNMLGTLIYNDSNSNGFMDIGVKDETIGSKSITTANFGEEALYRLDLTEIENRTFDAPETTAEVLSFGLNFDGVQGKLNPVGINRDDNLFNDSTSLAGVHDIDDIATTFHFSVNGTAANIKFDYLMGAWSSSEKLEGLSLSQLFSTTVVDKKATKWRRTNNTELDPDFSNASQLSRMKFGSAGDPSFGEISLDDIPYLWNDESNETAIGQLIPLNIVSMTFGQTSSDSDQFSGIMKSTTKQTFVYSISYPKWDGKSIYHDPTYAAASGSTVESGTENTNEAPIPGFEVITSLLAFSLVTISITKKKRK